MHICFMIILDSLLHNDNNVCFQVVHIISKWQNQDINNNVHLLILDYVIVKGCQQSQLLKVVF